MREQTLRINGRPVRLVWKQVKRMTLRIKADGSLWVTLPASGTAAAAEAFVRSKERWIEEKLRQRAEKPAPPELRLVTGETLPLWGRPVTLQIKETAGTWRRAVLKAGVLELTCRPEDGFEARRQILFRFYQEEVKRQLTLLIPECQQAVGRKAAGWTIHPTKSRWGSCTVKTGKIRISTLLAAFPVPCMKGVVIHELCHLLVSGHGPKFYAEMDRAWPEWRQWDPLLKKGEPVLRRLFIPG